MCAITKWTGTVQQESKLLKQWHAKAFI